MLATEIPVIAGVEITTDEFGRFNLNALHKASGLGKSKQPSNWLRTDMALALIAEINQSSDVRTGNIDTDISVPAIKTINGGSNRGTFAHELLAISYAGWISPSFQLKVNQVFIDYRTGYLKPTVPQTLPEALRLAADAMEQVEVLKPKSVALDRIASSDGSFCVSDAAKSLQVRPKVLFDWLSAHKWIYRRVGHGGWLAYQDKIQRGQLEHKVATFSRGDGSEKVSEQVRVTSTGLAWLAENMEVA